MTTAWIAPSAEIYGDIRLGKDVSVWPQVVMRAESHYVEILEGSNVQDFCMLHVGTRETRIGAFCSLTHHSTVHGATIGDHCLVGINATVMDNAEVGDNCIIAGHSIIIEGTKIPANSVVAGVPGKVVATRNNYVANKINAMMYIENAHAYREGNHRRWSEAEFAERVKAWEASFAQELNG